MARLCLCVTAACWEQGLEGCTAPGHVPGTPPYTPTHTPTPRWPPKVSFNPNCLGILLIKPKNPKLCHPGRNAPAFLAKKKKKKKSIPSEAKITTTKYSCSSSKSPKHSEYRPWVCSWWQLCVYTCCFSSPWVWQATRTEMEIIWD